MRTAYLFCTLLFTILALPSYAQKHSPNSAQQITLSFAPIVRAAAPAVVNIHTTRTLQERERNPFANDPFWGRFFKRFNSHGGRDRTRNVQSLGSGVLLRKNGIIVTNAHVIEGADEIRISLSDGREFDASLLLSDEAVDLAFLTIDPQDESLPVLELDMEEKEVGDLVLAIGNPWGIGKTVTSGIISALSRTHVVEREIGYFIQTDAAINPGNSGGALVGINGKLIGINTAIFTKSGGSQGIGFAIPARMVAALLRNLDKGQRRPWLGAELQRIDRHLAESLGLLGAASGAIVTNINPQSPLYGKVQVGDVIVGVNGEEARDPASVRYHYTTFPPGQSISVQIWRDGQSQEVRIHVIAPPETPPRNLTTLRGNHPMEGVRVGQLSPALAAELGIETEEGLIIMSFEETSPSQDYGFRKRDIILGIGGRVLKDIDDLTSALKTSTQSWRILINRNGRTLQLAFRK